MISMAIPTFRALFTLLQIKGLADLSERVAADPRSRQRLRSILLPQRRAVLIRQAVNLLSGWIG